MTPVEKIGALLGGIVHFTVLRTSKWRVWKNNTSGIRTWQRYMPIAPLQKLVPRVVIPMRLV
jgi:hypothetical protein